MQKLDSRMITVQDCKDCIHRGDVTEIMFKLVFPIAIALAQVNPAAKILPVFLHYMEALHVKLIKGFVVNDCLESKANRHVRKDVRIATHDAHGGKHRNRVGIQNMFNPGGGDFGGAGAGSTWDPGPEPLTGIIPPNPASTNLDDFVVYTQGNLWRGNAYPNIKTEEPVEKYVGNVFGRHVVGEHPDEMATFIPQYANLFVTKEEATHVILNFNTRITG